MPQIYTAKIKAWVHPVQLHLLHRKVKIEIVLFSFESILSLSESSEFQKVKWMKIEK